MVEYVNQELIEQHSHRVIRHVLKRNELLRDGEQREGFGGVGDWREEHCD